MRWAKLQWSESAIFCTTKHTYDISSPSEGWHRKQLSVFGIYLTYSTILWSKSKGSNIPVGRIFMKRQFIFKSRSQVVNHDSWVVICELLIVRWDSQVEITPLSHHILNHGGRFDLWFYYNTKTIITDKKAPWYNNPYVSGLSCMWRHLGMCVHAPTFPDKSSPYVDCWRMDFHGSRLTGLGTMAPMRQ